jgi:hypothetical protein
MINIIIITVGIFSHFMTYMVVTAARGTEEVTQQNKWLFLLFLFLDLFFWIWLIAKLFGPN